MHSRDATDNETYRSVDLDKSEETSVDSGSRVAAQGR